MKNIKDMFSNIFPDVPCRKRKDKESISQYLKDVYSILFTILKNKKTTENVKDYEKKLIAIRSAFKENARFLDLGWEDYVEEARATEDKNNWEFLYDRKQLLKYYKFDPERLLCPYCGIEPSRTFDHFLPKTIYASLSTTPFNLIPCCPTCNSKKGSFNPTKNAFFNPYLDESYSNWLAIEDFKLCEHTLLITYKINEFDNYKQGEKFKNTADTLDLLSRYSLRAVQFILNKKDYIKRRCTDEREVRELFEDYLGFLSLEENDNWKRVLCEYIQKESSKKAREMLLKYCNVSNRWASFKDGVRIPEYRQSLDNYLENTISNGEERNIYFISDEKFDQKIVCITNKISRVLLKDESNLSVFVPEIINLSDCMDADFYIFDSQGCTGIRYKCIGCEHGVIVLKKDAQRTSEVG